MLQDRFSDEPFGVRDIQFENPQIGIASTTTLPIFFDRHEIGCLGACRDERISVVEAAHAFERAYSVAFRDQDQHRATLRLASGAHHRQASRVVDASQQCTHRKVRRQPLAHSPA